MYVKKSYNIIEVIINQDETQLILYAKELYITFDGLMIIIDTQLNMHTNKKSNKTREVMIFIVVDIQLSKYIKKNNNPCEG